MGQVKISSLHELWSKAVCNKELLTCLFEVQNGSFCTWRSVVVRGGKSYSQLCQQCKNCELCSLGLALKWATTLVKPSLCSIRKKSFKIFKDAINENYVLCHSKMALLFALRNAFPLYSTCTAHRKTTEYEWFHHIYWFILYSFGHNLLQSVLWQQ